MARIIVITVRRIPLRVVLIALAAGLLPLVFRASAETAAPIHALLVGGGPDKENNTAQIEEHLRFVASLVPASSGRVVLFADGKSASKDLSYSDSSHLTPGQRALDIDDSHRLSVLTALKGQPIPEHWVRMVEEVVDLTGEEQGQMLGDTLPIGLRLLKADE